MMMRPLLRRRTTSLALPREGDVATETSVWLRNRPPDPVHAEQKRDQHERPIGYDALITPTRPQTNALVAADDRRRDGGCLRYCAIAWLRVALPDIRGPRTRPSPQRRFWILECAKPTNHAWSGLPTSWCGAVPVFPQRAHLDARARRRPARGHDVGQRLRQPRELLAGKREDLRTFRLALNELGPRHTSRPSRERCRSAPC